MNIKTITFEFKQTIHSTLTVSVENGYTMPTTGKSLIDFVNGVKNIPSEYIDDTEDHQREIEIIDYSIKEGKE